MRRRFAPWMGFAAVLALVTPPLAAAQGIVRERSIPDAHLTLNDDEMDPRARHDLDGAGGFDVMRCDTCPGPLQVVDLGTGAVVWSLDPASVPGLKGGRLNLWGFANLDGDPSREAVLQAWGPLCFPGPCPAPTFDLLVIDPATGREELRLGEPDLDHDFVFLGDVDGDSREELVVHRLDLGTGRVTVEIYGAGPPEPVAAPVSSAPRGGLAVAVKPNPAAGSAQAWFSVAHAGPVEMEVLDVAGRLVSRRTLAVPAPGRHLADVAADPRPSPGVYVVRLRQGGETAAATFTVLR